MVVTNEKWQCPPVMICGFNRPDCLAQVFAAVRAAQPRTLFLVLDAPREGRADDVPGCEACKRVFEDVDWPCDVHRNYAESNMGCGKRMTSGISWVFEHVDRAVLLEDDCVPSLSFFRFCDDLLERYKDDTRIGMIAGHDEHFDLDKIGIGDKSYYFDRMSSIWGWATWRRAWRKHNPDLPDWPDVVKSGVMRQVFQSERYLKSWLASTGALYKKTRNLWAAAWGYTMFVQGWLSIHPAVNLISNVGMLSSRGTAPVADASVRAPAVHAANKCVCGRSWYNRPYGEMTFPLRHPITFIPNLKSERCFCDEIYAEPLWRKVMKLPRRIVSKIKRVVGHVS